MGPTRCHSASTPRCRTWGDFAATRRVARTLYLGSAPTAAAANRGIEDRRVKLGCVMPGESPAVFGDALRRLAGAATYLYQDGPRYWYSTQPTVTKLAEDRAEQLKREPDQVVQDSTSACATTCARWATSAASTRCRSPGRTCPTTWTRGWWCWDRPALQQGATARPKSRRRPSSNRVATRRGFPEYACLPGRRQDAASGSRRGRAEVSWRGSRSWPRRSS